MKCSGVINTWSRQRRGKRSSVGQSKIEARRQRREIGQDKKRHVRGAQRVVIALDLVRSRFAEAQGFANEEEHKQTKKEHFMSDESKSRMKRAGAKLEAFHEKKDETRNQNKLQKERGIDETRLVADRMPCKNTKSGLHLAQLQEELKAQKDSGELSEEERRMNHTKLVRELKRIDSDKTSFVPKTCFFQNFLVDGGMGDVTEDQEVDDPNLDGE